MTWIVPIPRLTLPFSNNKIATTQSVTNYLTMQSTSVTNSINKVIFRVNNFLTKGNSTLNRFCVFIQQGASCNFWKVI